MEYKKKISDLLYKHVITLSKMFLVHYFKVSFSKSFRALNNQSKQCSSFVNFAEFSTESLHFSEDLLDIQNFVSDERLKKNAYQLHYTNLFRKI